MTVEELIAALRVFPQGAEVNFVSTIYCEYSTGEEIGSIDQFDGVTLDSPVYGCITREEAEAWQKQAEEAARRRYNGSVANIYSEQIEKYRGDFKMLFDNQPNASVFARR